jgi:ribonuclease III
MAKLVRKLRARLSNPYPELRDFIKNVFGFYPENIHLYELAFRHKSVAQEISHGAKNSNERLEYLGDSILDAVVADYLFKIFPYKDEGFLTQMRSKMVSRQQLNALAQQIGLNDLIHTTKDVKSQPKSLLGDAFEALIGAVYLDKGFDFTKKVLVERIIKIKMDIDELEQTENNYKSRLIEWSQKEKTALEFRHTNSAGVNNSKQHEIEVWVDNKFVSKAKGNNIKAAEQRAAELACGKLFKTPVSEEES